MIAVLPRLTNRRYEICLGLASVASVALFLYLGRHLTFFHDEWAFPVARGAWTIDAFMRPHNEHWALGLAVVYKTLLALFGLRSYLPYQLMLLLLHALAAAGLYRILKSQSGPAVALAGATLLLFLGAAWEDILWAFQIGQVGATAAGTWALALLLGERTHRRKVLAAVLLVAAVATQGVGLVFVAAAIVLLLAEPGRRRDGWVVLPALAAFSAWFAVFGRETIESHQNPFTLDALAGVPAYIVSGATSGIGALTGSGPAVGLVVFVILGLATVWHLVGRAPLREAAVVGFVGLVAQFGLIGLVRVGDANSSRYAYTAAIFAMIAMSGWLGKRVVGSGLRAHAVIALLWSVAVVANVSAARDGRDILAGHALETRAAITLIEEYGGTPALPADVGLFPVPSRNQLDEIIAAYGSPLQDAFRGPPIPVPDPVLDDVLYRLVGDSFTEVPVATSPEDGRPPDVVLSGDVSIREVGGCVVLDPNGPDPRVTMLVPAGQSVAMSSTGGESQAFLTRFDDVVTDANSLEFWAARSQWYVLTTPDIGDAVWRLRVDPPVNATTRVCAVGLRD